MTRPGNRKIKAIIWDIGNVLLKLHFEKAHDYFMKKAGLKKEEYFMIPVLQSESIYAFEKGQISEKNFFSMFCLQLGIEMSLDQFRRVWNDIFTENLPLVKVFESTVEMGVPAIGLSNTNAIHLPYIQKKFSFFRLFTGIIASYREGMLKPENGIYRLALSKFGLEARSTLFVDDRLENIIAARAMGIVTFHYQFNDSDFVRELESYLGDHYLDNDRFKT